MSYEFNKEENKWIFFEETDRNALVCENEIYEVLPVTDKRLDSTDFNIYIYMDYKDNKLYFKLGKADNTINTRYNKVTGNPAKYNMLFVYSYKSAGKHVAADKPIHDILKERAKNDIGFKHAEKEILNTEEAYCIENPEGIKNFIKIVEEIVNQKFECRREKPLYEDIRILVDDIYTSFFTVKFLILDLCARWGKTRTTLELCNKFNERIMILASYISTVFTSYNNEIKTNLNYENILLINPDDYQDSKTLKNECEQWLNSNEKNKIIWYLQLTGTKDDADFADEVADEEKLNKIFNRRTEVLKEFKNYTSNFVVEESDFGAWREKQGDKIKNLMETMNCRRFIAETGTAAEKIKNIFPNEEFEVIKKDYILHVLTSKYRKNAVGINWYILNNRLLADIVGKEVMENFSDMMKVEDGKIREEQWFREFFKWFFLKEQTDNMKNNRENRETCRVLMKNHPYNEDYATLIFTPNENEIHAALKKLLINILPEDKFLIKIIDGDHMTNKNAERICNDAINDAKNVNKKVIFIASGMANRSFSVSKIKNIILFVNDPSFESLQQKIARGLTPINNENNIKANIIDFRLNYKNPEMAKTYFENIGLSAINGEYNKQSLNENEYIELICRHDKISFYEYFWENKDPFHELNAADIKRMMHTENFGKLKSINIFEIENKNIRPPKQCGLNEDGFKNFKNTNVKGDSNKKQTQKNNENENFDNTDQNEEIQQNDILKNKKMQHWLFLINHANCFMSYDPRYLKSGKFIYNVINFMSDEQKNAYETTYEIDMNTITDIVNIADKHGQNFDDFLN